MQWITRRDHITVAVDHRPGLGEVVPVLPVVDVAHPGRALRPGPIGPGGRQPGGSTCVAIENGHSTRAQGLRVRASLAGPDHGPGPRTRAGDAVHGSVVSGVLSRLQLSQLAPKRVHHRYQLLL